MKNKESPHSRIHLLKTLISVFIFFCCIFRTLANADWINLSGAQNAPNIAEIHINDDYVRIDLEIFVNPYTGRPIPGPPKDKRLLYAELFFAFTGKPQTLSRLHDLPQGRAVA